MLRGISLNQGSLNLLLSLPTKKPPPLTLIVINSSLNLLCYPTMKSIARPSPRPPPPTCTYRFYRLWATTVVAFFFREQFWSQKVMSHIIVVVQRRQVVLWEKKPSFALWMLNLLSRGFGKDSQKWFATRCWRGQLKGELPLPVMMKQFFGNRYSDIQDVM